MLRQKNCCCGISGQFGATLPNLNVDQTKRFESGLGFPHRTFSLPFFSERHR